jgi:alkaline phosphatase
MGTGHVTADYFYNSDSPFLKFDVLALVDARPDSGQWIPDAAAAATAIATGEQVEQGALSQDAAGNPIPTILEIAEKRGKSTGVITTTSLTTAVPAAFMAHAEQWGSEYDIARQISESDVDVLLGGGRRFFQTVSEGTPSLIGIMENRGYTFVSQQQQLELLLPQNTEKLLGLFAQEALRQANHRSLSLSLMTEKALGILSKNKHGFILEVEGSQIDWRAHEKDDAGLLMEIKDFADAVNYGLRFQQEHPEVLIVVIGTNETGGVYFVHDSRQENAAGMKFITGEHTANLCPAFAKGPRAECLRGVMTISELGRRLINLIKD